MKSRIIPILIAIIPFIAQAQIRRSILNKAKDKINQRIDKKLDSAMDKSLDELEGKSPSANANTSNTTETSSSPQEATTQKGSAMSPYIKFDFIPGEQIICFNELSAETLGELPIGWNSNGNGSVVTINGLNGNWVQMLKTPSISLITKKIFQKI